MLNKGTVFLARVLVPAADNDKNQLAVARQVSPLIVVALEQSALEPTASTAASKPKHRTSSNVDVAPAREETIQTALQ
jgi:hypothetical protein